MSQLSLTLACGEYDRTQALIDGRVQVDGVDLHIIPLSDAFDRHRRMIRQEEFDVCELSLSSYLMARQRGQAFQGIPVFPYRMFRHGYILVNERSGIREPADLRGKRLGTPMYQTTTALWVRGHLLHEYGVAPEEITWHTETPELVPFKPGAGVTIDVGEPGDTERLLATGALDAAVLIEEVPPPLLRTPGIRRLFPNFPEVERELFLRTHIYPMMHALVAKAAILQEHPWLAQELQCAFEEAKQVALTRLRFPRTSLLVWSGFYREQEIDVFGDDPYPFGIEPNRATLDALVSYSFEQGLTQSRFGLDQLFPS